MTHALILGCGYVGKAVAKRWYPHVRLTVTTTTSERLSELQLLAHQAIVLRGNDLAGVRSQLQEPSVVLLTIGAPNADAYEETYLQTAKTLVEALADASTVRQVIYTGSYAVYGDQQGAWVDETTPIAPATRNGKILAETEQILLQAARPDRQICIFRLGGIYGPNRELIKIYRRVAGTTRSGDGKDAANWVHLDDIVGAIDFAYQHSLNGIYNLVGTQPITSGELLERVCAAHQLAPVSWDTSQKSTRPYNARVSNQKLRKAGYQFIYPEIQETM